MNNKPIRILQWGLFSGRGGIEAFIMDLYRNIDKTKVQFDFLEAHDYGELPYEEEIESMGGRVFRILYSKSENYKKSKKCVVEFLKEHPEIVGMHVHANFLYGSLLKDAKKAGLPIRIIHSHNSSTGEKENLKGKLRDLVVRHEINKYPNIYFACSDIAAEFMFPRKSYMWIKNGIDIESFDFSDTKRNKIRKELGIKDETVIGFVGNLRMQKNPFYAIDIFQKYLEKNDNSKMIIAGKGILEEEVIKYTVDKGISDKVIFLGLRSDVDCLYQAMDAFVLPSMFEGLPIVLVEAQTSGLPCFVADNITRQIEVTSNIKYISIFEKPEEWANIIEKTLKSFERKSCKEQIIYAGFRMKDVAMEIQNYYLDCYAQL